MTASRPRFERVGAGECNLGGRGGGGLWISMSKFARGGGGNGPAIECRPILCRVDSNKNKKKAYLVCNGDMRVMQGL